MHQINKIDSKGQKTLEIRVLYLTWIEIFVHVNLVYYLVEDYHLITEKSSIIRELEKTITKTEEYSNKSFFYSWTELANDFL